MIEKNLSRAFKQMWGNVQVSAFAPLLSDQDIITGCKELKHVWRHSLFPPPSVVRSELFHALHPDHSIANTVEHLVAERSLAREISASAWSQARDRLPQELLPILMEQTAGRARKEFPCRWHGREVTIFDGTTVSMPDAPDLVKEFGYRNGNHGHSRFPIGRILAALHAGARVIIRYHLAPYTTSEVQMYLEILPSLPRGGIRLFDRYFSGFAVLAASLQKGDDFVTRLHQRRDAKALIKSGKRLGPNQWLVTLRMTPEIRTKYAHLNLPESIQVRLIRFRYRYAGQPKTLWPITSLLDCRKYPLEEIVQLYRDRWGIETHYAHLKVTLQMAVLRSKTVANIHREVAAIMLVHNLLWHLVCRAAQKAGVSPTRISFARTIKTVLAYCPRLTSASPSERVQIFQQMMQRIATHVNPYRPGRHEPRLVKRDRNHYSFLRIPREEARKRA